MNSYRVYIATDTAKNGYWVIRANSPESALAIGWKWSTDDSWLGQPTGRVELAV